MQFSTSNLNFSARISRNPDLFGYEKTKQETLSIYDAEINRLRTLKKQAKDFDEFMHSKEIKELTNKLPKQDEIIMKNSCYEEMDTFNANPQEPGRFSLTYIQDETKHELIQPAQPFAHKKFFDEIKLPDGNINKEGIKAWLESLVYLFAEK